MARESVIRQDLVVALKKIHPWWEILKEPPIFRSKKPKAAGDFEEHQSIDGHS